jgi:hypothetical protein
MEQTSCVLYNQLEPGSRFYAMRPLSEQDTVPLYASPTVVNRHQKQLNDTPATSTQAESSRYIILPLHHLTAMQCFCTRYHFAGPQLAKCRSKHGDGRLLSGNRISSMTGSVLAHKYRMGT